MNVRIWGLVAVGLSVVPMSVSAADVATPVSGRINAAVTATLHFAEVVDQDDASWTGTPTALAQTAYAISGSLSGNYAEGHTNITATWASADQGTFVFQKDGTIHTTVCCANAVYNDVPFTDAWQYTFVATTNGVFHLEQAITGSGFGANGYYLYVNGVFLVGLYGNEDGTERKFSFNVPLVAGQTYTVSLVNSTGFSGEEGSYNVAGTISFDIQSPDESIDDLIDDVNGLNLPGGIGKALQAKLQKALDALNRGQTALAISMLESFINFVEAQRGKALTNAQADELIASVQTILDSL